MRRRLKRLLLFLLALVVIVATVQVIRWGRPLPAKLALTAQGDGNIDGHTDHWEYAVLDQPASRFVEYDDDSDGRVDRFLYFNGEEVKKQTLRNRGRDQPRRQLILCLDGVPFEVMDRMWQQGAFREFFAPQRLVSTFPADTDVALATVFHAPKVRGYENRYFDRKENQIKGGVWVTLTQDISYHRLLDYTLSGWLRGPSFILPEKAFFGDLGRFRKLFLRSQQPRYIAHIASTDPLFHLRSVESVRQYLLAVDAVVRELLYVSDDELEITLFSDHGHTLTKSKRVEFEKFLEASGYKMGDRLGEPRSVVVPIYGLVGTIAIYARPEDVAPLAQLAVGLDGVEFSARRESDAVVIEGKRGQARILFDAGRDAFRYEPLEGDPLRLNLIIEQLRRDGMQDSDGFIKQSDFIGASLSGSYPDALRRLYGFFTNYVENRADLILNLEDGYYFGSRRFDWFVDITSTHGSLNAGSSLGFIMSTSRRLPEWMVVEEALRGRLPPQVTPEQSH